MNALPGPLLGNTLFSSKRSWAYGCSLSHQNPQQSSQYTHDSGCRAQSGCIQVSRSIMSLPSIQYGWGHSSGAMGVPPSDLTSSTSHSGSSSLTPPPWSGLPWTGGLAGGPCTCMGSPSGSPPKVSGVSGSKSLPAPCSGLWSRSPSSLLSMSCGPAITINGLRIRDPLHLPTLIIFTFLGGITSSDHPCLW